MRPKTWLKRPGDRRMVWSVQTLIHPSTKPRSAPPPSRPPSFITGREVMTAYDLVLTSNQAGGNHNADKNEDVLGRFSPAPLVRGVCACRSLAVLRDLAEV